MSVGGWSFKVLSPVYLVHLGMKISNQVRTSGGHAGINKNFRIEKIYVKEKQPIIRFMIIMISF